MRSNNRLPALMAFLSHWAQQWRI